jgi:hypothetical protein
MRKAVVVDENLGIQHSACVYFTCYLGVSVYNRHVGIPKVPGTELGILGRA